MGHGSLQKYHNWFTSYQLFDIFTYANKMSSLETFPSFNFQLIGY